MVYKKTIIKEIRQIFLIKDSEQSWNQLKALSNKYGRDKVKGVLLQDLYSEWLKWIKENNDFLDNVVFK